MAIERLENGVRVSGNHITLLFELMEQRRLVKSGNLDLTDEHVLPLRPNPQTLSYIESGIPPRKVRKPVTVFKKAS